MSGQIQGQRNRQTERLALARQYSLKLAMLPPDPPRGVLYSPGSFSSGSGTHPGVVTWEPPHETRNITHYRIYADHEENFERSVPKPQRKATAVNAEVVLVSSYNEATGLESRLVLSRGPVLDADLLP